MSIFDVAVIKPCNPEDVPAPAPRSPSGEVSSQERLRLCNIVASFINTAYLVFANGRVDSLPRPPLEGGPAWVRSNRYSKAMVRIGYGGTEPHRAQFTIRQGLAEMTNRFNRGTL
jgi:hypothetical protein